jgi:hypothetical protein
MHLEGPWLSTTGKKKGKQKWASAEHKRRAEELDRSWRELQKKWEEESNKKKRDRALSAPILESIKPFRRETPHIPSLNGGVDTGPALKAPDKVYTGTKIKGIGTMHKSNAVPIFSDEEAVDISRMRR